MSRPLSTVVTPLSTHKQSLPELLLANLRLLDLDRREDWPDITVNSFTTKDSQQNQKQRIKCTEWILYRLFELWDPEETRDKLQPFFPPLEPLQSLNLRGALFRALNELKKNGVLGRESVLRKTMLDECKGEKLMELLVVFSNVVLRRRDAQHYKSGRSVAYKLASTPILNAVQQGSLLPLAVAHTASLSNMLQMRQEKKKRLAQFNDLLDGKRLELRERIKTSVQSRRRESSAAEEIQIKKVVQENWSGSNKWPQTILGGDNTNSADLPLQQPFNEIWNVVLQGRQLRADRSNSGLLASLDQRVRMQNERLQIWQEFHEKLKESHAQDNRSSQDERTTSSIKAAFNFNRHQGLQFIPGRTTNGHGKDIVGEESNYESIMHGLRNDLDAASKPRRVGGAGWSSKQNGESSIQGHDLFSPVKPAVVAIQKRPLEHRVPASRTNLLQERPTLLAPTEKLNGTNSKINGNPEFLISSQTFNLVSSAPRDKVESPRLTDVDRTTVPEAETTDRAVPEKLVDEDETAAERIISSVINAAPSPAKQPLSLTERTRMSMAYFSAPRPEEESDSVDSGIAMQDPEAESENTRDEKSNRRMSLLDRTRLSMAQVPSQPLQSKKPARNEFRQSLFPINQFETPGRPRAAPSPRRDATPTEKLFSDDAEYASIFKSRPRIAMSPIISPEEGKVGELNGQLDLDEEEEDISEDWGSSPLGKKTWGNGM